jgi:hypothetical protein
MMLGLAVLVLAIVVILLWSRTRRRTALKSRFGPEYERAVHEIGDEGQAETILAERQKRVSHYTIKTLPSQMRDHFVQTWRHVQAQFVDDPHYAVTRADDLVGEVMAARGYPVRDFDERAADLSVDHPEVVQNYRSGHDIAVRHARGEASTEDLRTAMIHYRALFDDLVSEPAQSKARVKEIRKETHRG